MQTDWLVRPKHLPRGDTKQKRGTDLPGSTGDADLNGRLHTNFLATDLHQPSSEATAWQADETQTFLFQNQDTGPNPSESVRICAHLWLNSAASFQQLAN